MGFAVTAPRRPMYVSEMFHQIALLVADAGTRGLEPDVYTVADLLADALAHPDSRMPTLLALSDFVSSSLAGSVPNLDRWSPPAK